MTGRAQAAASVRRGRSRAHLVALVLLTVLSVGALSVWAATRETPSELGREPRTIVLIARNMGFYVDGEITKNPRIVAGRGERLRFVLSNDDPGMAHDLRVPSLSVATKLLRNSGMTAETLLHAPQQAGEHVYLCSLHSRIMRGILEVR